MKHLPEILKNVKLIQEAVPLLEQQEKSSITCISSIAGYQPMPMLGAYSVSKTALIGLCKGRLKFIINIFVFSNVSPKIFSKIRMIKN